MDNPEAYRAFVQQEADYIATLHDRLTRKSFTAPALRDDPRVAFMLAVLRQTVMKLDRIAVSVR